MIDLDLSILVTIIYVAILYVFLSKFFFGPVTRILADRHKAIQGSLEEAATRIEEVEKKTSAYEAAVREARADAYKHQESIREEALEVRAQLLNDARREADQIIVDARARLETETAAARKELEGEIDALAARLSGTLLQD